MFCDRMIPGNRRHAQGQGSAWPSPAVACARTRADIFSFGAPCYTQYVCCYLVREVRELQIPDTIQPGENSKGGGADDSSHIRGERERQPQRPVPGSGRQALGPVLELARERRERQRPCRRLRQLQQMYQERPADWFRPLVCPSQPPSIRPTSSSTSEIRTYFLLSSALISQAICRKNFKESNFMLASRITGSLFSLLRRLAVKISPITSVNSSSIFPPKE